MSGRRKTETEGSIRDVHAGNRDMDHGLRGRDVAIDYTEKDLNKAMKDPQFKDELARTGNIHEAAANVLGRKYTPPEGE